MCGERTLQQAPTCLNEHLQCLFGYLQESFHVFFWMCVSSLTNKLSRIQLAFCNCHLPRNTHMCKRLSWLTLNSNEWVSANLNICNHTYFAIEISCKQLQKWSTVSRYQWISNVRTNGTMDNASVYLFGHFAFPADWITDQATDDGGQHTSCNVSCE